MSHDATKCVLGMPLMSPKDVAIYDADPATFIAGLAVRKNSDDAEPTLSLLKTDGEWAGISLGKSESNHKKTSVAVDGLSVPIRCHLKRSTGVVTITSVANLVSGTDDSITVGATVFTAQAGAATPGDATFQATGTTAATATSLATQINAHATASTLVYAVASSATVTLYAIVEGAGTGHDVALAYTDNDSNIGATLSGLSGGKLTGGSNTISDIAYISKGAKAYINDATGKADINISGFTTISDAMYVSEELSGIDEANSTTYVAAAYVDMQGGL